MEINFLPKQTQLYNEILNGSASVIGVGGGRGSTKSSAIDRIIITLLAQQRNLNICCVMRNYSQIASFHIEAISNNFPELKDNIKKTTPAVLTIGNSRCEFAYGDSVKDIEKNFRSGNFDYMFIDQSELFYEEEVREIQKCVRSTKGFKAKLILSFNMRGAGIKFHRKWFHNNEVENPDDYKFIKFNPWDNVYWSLRELKIKGYSIKDYYRWTDDQRKQFSILYGDYTKNLSSGNQAIAAADFHGSWDAVEGCYFDQVFDLQTVRINRDQVFELQKDWATHFISQDWGRNHYTVNYWHFRVALKPSEVNQILGWKVTEPINVVCTYRESILNGKESNEIAQEVVNLTPTAERKKVRSFYVGKDAFDVKDSKNTIAVKQSEVLKANGLPGLIRADWSRIGGWSLMSQLLKATKNKGFVRDDKGTLIQAKDVWLISSECAQLLQSIPAAMRDEDDIEDVQKTDKSKTDIDMDCLDACRYGLKSMLNPKQKSKEDEFNEIFSAAPPEQQMLMSFKKYKEQEALKNRPSKNTGSWRNRL